MRRLVMVALLAQIGLIAAAPGVQAVENWYLRGSGDGQASGGVSAPLRYCLRGILGTGGVCANEHYLAEMADRERHRQPARRRAKERSDR